MSRFFSVPRMQADDGLELTAFLRLVGGTAYAVPIFRWNPRYVENQWKALRRRFYRASEPLLEANLRALNPDVAHAVWVAMREGDEWHNVPPPPMVLDAWRVLHTQGMTNKAIAERFNVSVHKVAWALRNPPSRVSRARIAMLALAGPEPVSP